MLSEGDPAPSISALNQHTETITPDFAEPTVVYFYPRDGTPGCTIEARQFQADLATFEDIGVTVYGVSTDSVETHTAFAEEEGLTFDLLADPDGSVANDFGLEVQNNYVERQTFVLADEKVKAVVDADTINPDGHADAVLELTRELTT